MRGLRHLPVGLAVVLAMTLGVSAAQAKASFGDVPAPAWVTNGPVYAIAAGNGITYLGGSFNQIGPATGPGVGIDAATGQSLGLPEVAGCDCFGGDFVVAAATD